MSTWNVGHQHRRYLKNIAAFAPEVRDRLGRACLLAGETFSLGDPFPLHPVWFLRSLPGNGHNNSIKINNQGSAEDVLVTGSQAPVTQLLLFLRPNALLKWNTLPQHSRAPPRPGLSFLPVSDYIRSAINSVSGLHACLMKDFQNISCCRFCSFWHLIEFQPQHRLWGT